MIAHMPGAAGNFLTRILAQGHHSDPIEQAQYPERFHSRNRHPLKADWLAMEREWQEHHRTYQHSHDREPVWLRITVVDREEWLWACSNARWKNSTVETQFLASDPRLPAQHHIRLRSLWQWPTLSAELAHLQENPINTHQHSLWQQWRETWCPHTDQTRWRDHCESLWGHLTPSYIQ